MPEHLPFVKLHCVAAINPASAIPDTTCRTKSTLADTRQLITEASFTSPAGVGTLPSEGTHYLPLALETTVYIVQPTHHFKPSKFRNDQYQQLIGLLWLAQ